MRKIVNSQSTKLLAGESEQQYLVFRPVREYDLVKIDHARNRIGKHTRMTYYPDSDLLIVKLMPSATHEVPHINLTGELYIKIGRMGLSTSDLCGIGATRFKSPRSAKEGDSTFKPSARVNKDDWPTVVIESGVSESLARLRVDARWWLVSSQGAVKIVIIISMKIAQRKIRVETWELGPIPQGGPTTRAASTAIQNGTLIPTKTQEITIMPKQPD